MIASGCFGVELQPAKTEAQKASRKSQTHLPFVKDFLNSLYCLYLVTKTPPFFLKLPLLHHNTARSQSKVIIYLFKAKLHKF